MQKNIVSTIKNFKQQFHYLSAFQFAHQPSIQFTHGHNKNTQQQNNVSQQQTEQPKSNKLIKMTVRDAIREAIAEEMEKDENVFLMGEEVGKYDGAYKVSKSLLQRFGEKRVIDTPITEAGFTGLGVGASLGGLKPVIEFMTFNFAMQAIDHIVNSAAKLRYMSGGDLASPIVFRGLNGASAAVGAQHSQCYAAWYAHVPGLITLAPYDVEDAKGLFHSAIACGETVVFLENEVCYNYQFEITEEVNSPDFKIPIGKAKIQRPGEHVTVVSFARMVHVSLQAAEILEKEGISVEVINLRSIKPLDRDTIIQSIKKTNRIVTVEEGWPQHGIGAEIAAMIMETSAFDYLDHPLERITGADIPMPYAFDLEDASKPQVQNVVNAVKRTLIGKKHF